MTEEEQMNREAKRLIWLALFTFIISPALAWESVIFSDETAVFASLSRMIWYSGSATGIFIAMAALFIPMLAAFFLANSLSGITDKQRTVCRVCMIFSCAVLYLGAMWVMPSDGRTMTPENVWHGVLSFGGILMIFLTYCLYTVFVYGKDRDGAGLLTAFLIFTMITGSFAVFNIFDEKSYVIASAVSELYALTMLSIIGYLTYYLAYRKNRSDALINGSGKKDEPVFDEEND